MFQMSTNCYTAYTRYQGCSFVGKVLHSLVKVGWFYDRGADGFLGENVEHLSPDLGRSY